MNDKNLIVIAGSTAVGKTKTAIELAKKLNTEIISCDSRQFYKEISIGTAKPSPQELSEIKHHFINNKSLSEPYSAGDFERDVLAFLEHYFSDNNTAIMVGGSGLYIDAVCNGFDDIPHSPEIRNKIINEYNENGISSIVTQLKKLDPKYCEKADLQNSQRIMRALEVCLVSGKPYSSFLSKNKAKRPFNIIKIALNDNRESLYNRINKRVDNMINEGLLEEAKSVYHLKGIPALKTVGYQELFDYFENKISKQEAIELIKRNSRRYAKRQLTWLRRTNDYEWFTPYEFDKIVSFISEKIK